MNGPLGKEAMSDKSNCSCEGNNKKIKKSTIKLKFNLK